MADLVLTRINNEHFFKIYIIKMESFNNKRVLVTGAANGIGCGIVEELIRNGATVIALDKDELNLNKLKQKFHESIEIVICDLSDWKSTNETVKKSFPIDFLVNNAGIASIQPLNEITEHDYDSTFTINVKAVINITKTVTGDWIQRNHRGVVVNLSSQASIAGLLNHALYCASKGAIDAFTRAIALELGPYNIRVNCVNPTVVMTELGRKVWSEPQLKEGMLSKIPLKRFAEIRDVVDVILFLLSDHSRMITGACLPEFEYLANHLTNDECRRLTAAIHFESYEAPNPLDQAERKVPKELTCLELLLHWNSASGEGRGQTHEIIEHRLRQMGKYKLADWLGHTVFRELGNDLEESLQVGLKNVVDNTTKKSLDLPMPPIEATINPYDITEWSSFDTICLVVLVLLILTIFGLFIRICVEIIARRLKKRREQYKQLRTDSESEYTLFEMPL